MKGSRHESSTPSQKPFQPLPARQRPAFGLAGRQLRMQADSLSGKLDEFWPDIKESRWFGGSSEGWERAPYWLDGVIPLAFLLDDAALKDKVLWYMDYIIIHQQEDGWLGPRANRRTGKTRKGAVLYSVLTYGPDAETRVADVEVLSSLSE